MLIELITADYVYNPNLFELINNLIIILIITTAISWKIKRILWMYLSYG